MGMVMEFKIWNDDVNSKFFVCYKEWKMLMPFFSVVFFKPHEVNLKVGKYAIFLAYKATLHHKTHIYFKCLIFTSLNPFGKISTTHYCPVAPPHIKKR